MQPGVDPAVAAAIAALTDAALQFNIAFVRRDGRGGGGAAGSGTLVELDGRRGVLTAWHVLEPLTLEADVSLTGGVGDSKFGGVRLKFHPELRLKIAHRPGGSGPDLGFLGLPDDVAGSLTRASFFNLGRASRAAQILGSPPISPLDSCFVTGIVEEFTRDVPAERGLRELKEFRIACFSGHAHQEAAVAGFDYLRFEPNDDGSGSLPFSYGGCSGGGLWRLTPSTLQPVFSGIAFWQSDVMAGKRDLRCHGRISIHQRAVEAIRTAVKMNAGWG